MTNRNRLAVIPLTLVSVLLVACAGSAPSASPGGMVDALGDWQLSAGALDDAPIPLVPANPITMTVEGTRVGGRAACNLYGGDITIVAGELRFGDMVMTEMACDEPVMRSESAFLAAMARVRGASRDGDRLTLVGPGVELIWDRLEPPPAAALVGTTWILETLIAGEVASSVQGQATLMLRPDGTLAGSTGCRDFVGSWTDQGDGTVALEPMMDAIGCTDPLGTQDRHVTQVLGGRPQAIVDGPQLTLTTVAGLGLVYRAEGP
ncbi:MAG: META domain-containing protein [Chloroflexota bacterium]